MARETGRQDGGPAIPGRAPLCLLRFGMHLVFIALLVALAVEPPTTDIPSIAHIFGGRALPTLTLPGASGPALVGVLVPAGGPVRGGLWIRALDRGPAEARRIHGLLAVRGSVNMSDAAQWMVGAALHRVLPTLLPDDASLVLVPRGDTVAVSAAGQAIEVNQPFLSRNTGALASGDALPPPTPTPESPVRECRGTHRMDCGKGCTNTRSDRRNCGSCGMDCGKHACVSGQCGPFCYTDSQCKAYYKGDRGRCLTPLTVLRGTPEPIEACRAGSCGKWKRCDLGTKTCVPLRCRSSGDCPAGGSARCLRSGAQRICVPRGQCVAHFNIPAAP
ncbi:MAG: hypothetical protein ACI9OJ_001744 [Myxococcota bacterium]|jgi:hypothetical protein